MPVIPAAVRVPAWGLGGLALGLLAQYGGLERALFGSEADPVLPSQRSLLFYAGAGIAYSLLDYVWERIRIRSDKGRT
jgi:hypothetical protein